jgi:hypothetical protein
MTSHSSTTTDKDWQTTISSTSTDTGPKLVIRNPSPSIDAKKKSVTKPGHRPTDPLEEYFYEQAKFFRHLERKFDRFNKNSKEDEQRARAGKFKHVSKPKPKVEPEAKEPKIPSKGESKAQTKAEQKAIPGPSKEKSKQ